MDSGLGLPCDFLTHLDGLVSIPYAISQHVALFSVVPAPKKPNRKSLSVSLVPTAWLHRLQKKFDELLKCLERIVTIKEATLGREHADTKEARSLVAMAREMLLLKRSSPSGAVWLESQVRAVRIFQAHSCGQGE